MTTPKIIIPAVESKPVRKAEPNIVRPLVVRHEFIEPDKLGNFPEAMLVERKPSELWYVAQRPLSVTSRSEIVVVKSGDRVWVPLIPYLVDPSAEVLASFGVQYGAMFARLVPQLVKIITICSKPIMAVEHDGQSRWRVVYGVAGISDSK